MIFIYLFYLFNDENANMFLCVIVCLREKESKQVSAFEYLLIILYSFEISFISWMHVLYTSYGYTVAL